MRRNVWGKVIMAFVMAAAVGGSLLLGAEAAEAGKNTREMTIVAHRAGAWFAPENTLAALEQTIRDGSAMAEIDVQQLGDGTLIVMHDSSFKRTAGVDRNVWDIDYDEMRGYEVGSAFSEAYVGETIPTLEQMLKCADGRITLMIELKYTGREERLEESVLELLRQYHMERKCIVGSMNEEILQRVKELDGGIPTVFITHNLSEEQYDRDYADSYSIEARNLTVEMVERLHRQDKPVYGWTANSFASAKWIADCGADGIVTDNVQQSKLFLRLPKKLFASQ